MGDVSDIAIVFYLGGDGDGSDGDGGDLRRKNVLGGKKTIVDGVKGGFIL